MIIKKFKYYHSFHSENEEEEHIIQNLKMADCLRIDKERNKERNKKGVMIVRPIIQSLCKAREAKKNR